METTLNEPTCSSLLLSAGTEELLNRNFTADETVYLVDTEAQLLMQASRGNAQAFTRLYRKLLPEVERTLDRMRVRDHDEREDVCQEIFANLWEARDLLREINNAGNYIFFMTRNLVLRRRKKQDAYVHTELHAGHAIGSAACSDAELIRVMRRAIDELTPQTRSAFVLRYIYGLSTAEAAAQMQRSVLTVRNHHVIAKKIVEEKIEAYLKGQ